MPTSSSVRKVDVAIIGAGTAGLNARRAASTAGAEAVMIDPGPYGTTCARVGCMPSKLLIAPAEAIHKASLGDVFGFEAQVRVDGRRIMERVRRERDRFVSFVVRDMQEHLETGRLIQARATILDANTVQAGDETRIECKSIVVATGSSPWTPPPFRNLHPGCYLDNESVFELQDLPESLLVVGPGVIGLELGQAFHRLGVRVTIVGIGGLIGPFQDPKLKEAARKVFSEELDLHIDYALEKVETVEGGTRVCFVGDDGSHRDEIYEKVLVAAGRKPNIEGLGLEQAGVVIGPGGRLDYDRHTMRIGETNLFLAGDVNGERPLLHEASDEGRIAGANAAEYPQVARYPRQTELAVVFTDPQMALVGEAWTRHNCDDHRAGQVDYSNQGRARVMAENKGLVRVYGETETGLLKGAEMLGPDVEHTAHLLAWCIQQRLTVEQILEMPFYHPTVEEGIRTALRNLRENLGIHRPRGARCDEFGAGS